MKTITTRSPWYRRLVERALDHLLSPSTASASLHELDARTLADIGVDASEIASIEAEARGPRVAVTRRRLALLARA
jgi:hypothetical protein